MSNYKDSSIVTVGICPAWDVVCSAENIDWSSHSVVKQSRTVAGKAFNVSRALAQMGLMSVAAGLWGEVDYCEMLAEVESLSNLVDVRFTKAAGRTRENITVVDKGCNREMHLRAESFLANAKSLLALKKDLGGMVDTNSVCVFAGSMPGGEFLDGVISVVESAKKSGAKIVVDTSGDALSEIVARGGIEILKPNLDELSELAGVKVDDESAAIAQAANPLLSKAKIIVVTRGEKGAVVVTKDSVIEGRCITKNKIASTVGCGDYFLAGFLTGKSLEDSLAKGLKAAAARAWGDNRSWSEIEVEIKQL